MLRLKVTPVVGLPQFTGWSQVAESTLSVSVRLIVVYAISGKHAGNVGRDISEKVSDFYYYDIEQLHDFLQQLVEYVHAQECKIYFSCAVLGREKSIFATYGGSVFLKREEKSGKILMSDYEVKIVEGNYVDDDVFVLTTLQADQFLNEIKLKFNQGYDVDIIITSIVPGIHDQEDSSLSALVFISKDESAVPLAKTQEDEVIEIEDIEDTVIEQDNSIPHGEHVSDPQGLAQVSFEVDPVKVPSFVEKTITLIKPLLFAIVRKLKSFWLWLFKLIAMIFLKVWSFVRNFDFKKFKLRDVITNRNTYITDMKPKKDMLKIGLLVLLLIIIFVVLGTVRYQRNSEEERIQSMLAPIKEEVLIAQELSGVDLISTREVVAGAINQITTLEQENEKSHAVGLLSEAKQEFTTYLDSISSSEELQELDIFYDLRLARSDFISSGIDISENTLVLFDKDMKQILLLDHNTKKVTMRDFSQRETVQSVVVRDQTVYALFDGIYKFAIDFDTQSELETVRELGDSNRSATLIDAYDRYVYVVNPEKRNIYRYSETKDGYSEPIGWMKSATGIQYNELRSMAIDGDVWLTTSDGQLKKFAGGREETVSFRGLEVPFEKDIYVYTNENLENLYVLDPSNNRVVVMGKDGNFDKEFKSVSLAGASNLAVSESLGKIFVISGSIVYQINL